MLDDIQNRIKALQAFSFEQEMIDIVENNKDAIPPMIKEQLAAGKGGDDKPSTIFGRDVYAARTVAEKEQYGKGLGAVTDRITNYMSGDFYASLKINQDGKTFEADSDVPYFSEIQSYSTDALLEVDQAHAKEFGENITLPAIKESIKEKLGYIVT